MSFAKKNKTTEKLQISGFLLCDECYKKEKEDNFKEMLNIFSEKKLIFEGDIIIEDKLILGSIESSYLKDKLKELGVTHILMIGFFMTPIYPQDFIYENYEVNDYSNENILQYLVEGIRFIDNSKVCYCHCQLGKSRSASFAIAYVMYKNRIHFSKAFNFVKKKRKMIFPNEGFQCQLEDFDIILSNFDYDLNKCDEYIKKYLEERDEIRMKEKKYIINKLQEQAEQGKRKYSDTDLDSDSDDDKGKIVFKMGDVEEKEENNKDNNNDINNDAKIINDKNDNNNNDDKSNSNNSNNIISNSNNNDINNTINNIVDNKNDVVNIHKKEELTEEKEMK